MEGLPVIDFLTRRGDSRKARKRSVWNDKVNAKWLKVTIERVGDAEQQADPVEVAKRMAVDSENAAAVPCVLY